jgi:large subunit ribosomal protein L5
MPVGIKVTLRGNVMWEFLLRLVAIALPNIRDFRGVPGKARWFWQLYIRHYRS